MIFTGFDGKGCALAITAKSVVAAATIQCFIYCFLILMSVLWLPLC